MITINNADGSVFVGQVLKHGFGTETDRFGNRYEGQFNLNSMSGQGKMTFIDGSTYEGSWCNGRFNGQGALTYSNTSLLNVSAGDLRGEMSSVTQDAENNMLRTSATTLQH